MKNSIKLLGILVLIIIGTISCKKQENRIYVSGSFYSTSTGFQFGGDTVTFTSDTYNGSSYYWVFGDGATSTEKNPIHVYTEPGSYAVKLITYGGIGQHDEYTNNIQIKPTDLGKVGGKRNWYKTEVYRSFTGTNNWTLLHVEEHDNQIDLQLHNIAAIKTEDDNVKSLSWSLDSMYYEYANILIEDSLYTMLKLNDEYEIFSDWASVKILREVQIEIGGYDIKELTIWYCAR